MTDEQYERFTDIMEGRIVGKTRQEERALFKEVWLLLHENKFEGHPGMEGVK